MKSVELLASADSLFDSNEIEKAMSSYEEAARLAEREDNRSVLVEAYSQIGRCHLRRENLDQCRSLLSKAEAQASPSEPKGWSRYLGVKGRLEWKEATAKSGEISPEAPEAAATFRGMYAYCLQHDLHERAVDAANMMTIVADKDERIDWGLKGIAAAEKGELHGKLAALWNNHGWNLEDMGRYQGGLEALKKAREYHYRSERLLPRLIADWGVGHAYRMVGAFDSASDWMADVYARADSLYRSDPSTDHAEWLGLSARELGEIAVTEGRNPDALHHLNVAEAMLMEAGMAEWDAQGLEVLRKRIKELEESQR